MGPGGRSSCGLLRSRQVGTWRHRRAPTSPSNRRRAQNPNSGHLARINHRKWGETRCTSVFTPASLTTAHNWIRQYQVAFLSVCLVRGTVRHARHTSSHLLLTTPYQVNTPHSPRFAGEDMMLGEVKPLASVIQTEAKPGPNADLSAPRLRTPNYTTALGNEKRKSQPILWSWQRPWP